MYNPYLQDWKIFNQIKNTEICKFFIQNFKKMHFSVEIVLTGGTVCGYAVIL